MQMWSCRIQSLFSSLGDEVKGKTIALGGDGRYFNKDAAQVAAHLHLPASALETQLLQPQPCVISHHHRARSGCHNSDAYDLSLCQPKTGSPRPCNQR